MKCNHVIRWYQATVLFIHLQVLILVLLFLDLDWIGQLNNVQNLLSTPIGSRDISKTKCQLFFETLCMYVYMSVCNKF